MAVTHWYTLTRYLTWITQFKETMHSAFNIEELKTICFDLGIDYEDVPGHEKEREVFIRELISKCKREKRLDALFRKCKEKHPNSKWIEIY